MSEPLVRVWIGGIPWVPIGVWVRIRVTKGGEVETKEEPIPVKAEETIAMKTEEMIIVHEEPAVTEKTAISVEFVKTAKSAVVKSVYS